MILVDTSVIADILTKDPAWFEWSCEQIERWADQGPVVYNAIIFAELAVKFDTHRELEHRLSAFTCPPSIALRQGRVAVGVGQRCLHPIPLHSPRAATAIP